MTVSVIIPCYNRRDMVAEAIESALSQGDGVEVIVVDDGSSDGSDRVIAGFGDRIRSIRTANCGVSAARNCGLEAATGRYVRFLDSDDTMPAGAIAAQLAAAAGLGPRAIGVGDAEWVGPAGQKLGPAGYGYASVTGPGPVPRAVVLGRIMPPVLPLFPVAALREVGGFDTRLSLGEDHEMALRLLAAGYSFVRIPVPVCSVREHGGARLSRSLGPQGYARLAETFARCAQTLAAMAPTAAERAAFGKLVWRAARDAGREGFRAEAERLFALAQRTGGSGARDAALPVRLLYRVLPPYRTERLLRLAKRAAGKAT